MPRFTKKPVTIDAFQFTGDNLFDCLRFMQRPEHEVNNLELKATDCPIIHTPEGMMQTSPGDWIIRGVKGEYYPCKPNIFEMTYSAGDSGVITLKGNMPPEQFAKFKEQWRAEHGKSISRAVILDSEVIDGVLSLTDTEFQMLRDVAARDTLGEGYGAVLTKLLDRKHVVAKLEADVAKVVREAFRDVEKIMAETAAQVAPVPHSVLDAIALGTPMIIDQPPPTAQGDKRAIWELVAEDYKTVCVGHDLRVMSDVLDDMGARDSIGRERYGTPLTAFNGRDQFVDAYQELLDAAVYLRAAIEEGRAEAHPIYISVLHNLTHVRSIINQRASVKA